MAQARMTLRRLRAIRRSIIQFMVSFVSGVRYIRSERVRSRLTPRVSVPFGSAQPSHGCEGADYLFAGSRCDTAKPKDFNARLIEAVARVFLARREAEARRQMDCTCHHADATEQDPSHCALGA